MKLKTPNWMKILNHLSKPSNGDEINYASKISYDLNITGANLNKITKELIRTDLIQITDFDKRRKKICLSTKGTRVAEHLKYVFEVAE